VNTPGYRRGEPAPNKGMKLPPEVLTHMEMSSLLEACGRGPAGIRNQALLVVMWRAGARCNEALSLELRDVDRDKGTIRVRHGKGNKARTLGMDPQGFAVLDRWLALRATLEIPRGCPVFCTFSVGSLGHKLGGGYVRELLKRLAVRAGIEKRVHPHGLRHTHAAELMREGVSLTVIQRQLGHASLSITERYVSHLHPTEVVDTMQARHWPLPS
jgi:integrase/recombinase XerD